MKHVSKGIYVLLINLLSAQTIRVGGLGEIYFPAGWYAYVGSAMGGFKSRLPHHFRKSKKPHWHIDYMLQKATISSVIVSESQERNECTIAKALMKHFQCIVGFGCSDCKCKGHLLFLKNESNVEVRFIKLLRSFDYLSQIINNQILREKVRSIPRMNPECDDADLIMEPFYAVRIQVRH